MSLPLVTAVAPRWEGSLATVAASATEVHLVRRCADVAELVGVAAAGLARVVLVSSDLRGLDRAVVDRLRAEDVPVIAVHPPGDDDAARRLARWGVGVVLPADLTPEQLDQAVERLTLGVDDAAPLDEPLPGPSCVDPAVHGDGRQASAGGDQAGGGNPGRDRHDGDGVGGDSTRGEHSARDHQGGDSTRGERTARDHQGGDSTRGDRHAAGRTGRGHPADDPSERGQEARDRSGDARGRRAPAPPGADPSTGQEDADDLDLELRSLVEQERVSRGGGAAGPGVGTPSGPDGSAPPDDDVPPGGRPETGEVVVVWGAYGSPGRTTVAVNLAAELATVLDPVLLVDADTYGASVAQTLAVLDEAPGLVAACRAADQGTLDEERLDQLAPEVRPGLRVLTGLPRPDRWPEVRDSALADVLEQGRGVSRWVVVDVAPVLEQDEELTFDTAAPRRNGAALTALEAADRVIVVGVGDPLGLQRLVRALDQLAQHTKAPGTVVVTRVRPGPVGPEPGRRIEEALHRFAGADDVLLVPEDRDALDAALLHGRALREVRPGSPVRQALQQAAARLTGGAAQDRPGRFGHRGSGARRLLPPWSRPGRARG